MSTTICQSDRQIGMLSIIIPTRNRSDLLALALESLTWQTLDPEAFEVLVIDNGSTDQTKATAQAFSARLANLRYFYEPEPGLHSGRHRGMLEARGEVLVFADDDIEAFPTWLEAISLNFEDRNVAMVGGNNLPRFASPPPCWIADLWDFVDHAKRTLGYLSLIDFGDGRFVTSPHNIWGCNFSIRKDILLEAGGFHPDSFPNDLLKYRGDGETYVSQYVKDRNLTAIFDSRASIHHIIPDERLSLEYLLTRYRAQGISSSYAVTRANGKLLEMNSYLPIIGKYAKRIIRSITAPLFKNRQSSYLQLTKILLGIQLSHMRGFIFHQRQLRKDPDLLSWIKEKTYIKGNSA